MKIENSAKFLLLTEFRKIDTLLMHFYEKIMTTAKYRIPVSLTARQKNIFGLIGKENETSLAKIIIEFAQYGLENAEDDYLGKFADSLDEKITGFQNHEEFWKEIKS